MDRHDPKRNKKPKSKSNQHNIFAILTNNRQDRAWRRQDLYQFNSNVELAEYSLPIISDDKEAEDNKFLPGVVNVDGAHVKMGTKANKLDPIQPKDKSQISASDIMEEVDQQMEELEGEGEYEEQDDDRSLDSDQLDQLVNADDAQGPNQAKNSYVNLI